MSGDDDIIEHKIRILQRILSSSSPNQKSCNDIAKNVIKNCACPPT